MATEKYRKLLFAVIEMQKVGAELLGKLSVELEKGTITDYNLAFTNLIRKQEATIADMNAMKFNCNKSKIYDVSKTPIVLKNLIKVETIDKTLQNDILFSLDGFPISKLGKKRIKCGQCSKNCKEENFCCSNCNTCFSCNGNSQRCTTYKCNGSCRKPYKKKKDYCCDKCKRCFVCNQNLPANQQCSTYKCTDCSKLCKKEDYCCDVCNRCFACRKNETGDVCLTYKCTGPCGKMCKKEDFFCCNLCKCCDNCNSLLPLSQQCPAYKLRLGLEIDKLLRNLVSHLTLKTLEDFLDGNEIFPDFPIVYTWKELCDKFNIAMSSILDYMCDINNFTNPNVAALDIKDKSVRLEKLKFILDENSKENCDLNLLVNFEKVISEQNQNQIVEIKNDMEEIKKDMQKVIAAMKDELEDGQVKLMNAAKETNKKLDDLKKGQDNLTTVTEQGNQKIDNLMTVTEQGNERIGVIYDYVQMEMAKENKTTKEENNDQVKKWRSIDGGVVIEMTRIYRGDDEELRVSYSKISSKNNCDEDDVTINYKPPIANQKPYYETHIIDDTTVLLKIENVENGKYVIHAKSKSENNSYEISVESDSNGPCKEMYNVGIAVPYSDTKQYWNDIEKLISNPTMNKDSSLPLPLSKHPLKNLNDFEQMGLKYLQRNFLQNLVCFSPFETLEKKHEQVIVENFQKVLGQKYASRGKAVIVVGPSVKYHHHLVNNKSNLVSELEHYNTHRIVVFVEEISLVLVIAIAMDEFNVKDEISSVQDDVKNFINIHSHQILEEGLSIVGIIACPTVQRNVLKNILPFQFADKSNEFYNSLFICQDDLSCNFTQWWDGIIKVWESLKEYQTIKKSFKGHTFSKMIGQHMISLAVVNESLPTVSTNRHDQIQTLILNAKQLRAINSASLKKLIVGPFGSGKTLVAQRILKNLMGTLKSKEEKSTVCYINCDKYSIVDRHINRHLQCLADDKVKFVCGSLYELHRQYVNQHSSSSSLDLVELMKSLKLLPEKFPNPHFICDEVQCSVMTEDVAKTIDEYMESFFLHSHLVFIQQSIKKKREYQQHSIEADNFQLINGLEVHHLKSVMRVAVDIQKLIDAAQEIIRKYTMKVAIPKSNGNKSSTAPPTKSSFFPEMGNSLNTTSIEDLPQEHDRPHPFVPGNTSVTEEPSNVLVEDLDLSLKFISQSQTDKTNQNTVSTEFDFFNGKLGHNIQSAEKPKLIYLPNIDRNDDTIKILSHVFNNLFFNRNTNPVLISYSQPLIRLLNHGAKLCNKDTVIYIPSLQLRNIQPTKEEVMSRISNTSVLVTDHKSFLGMENETIVTLVDPTEKIMRHSIVEIISRCTSDLYVFAFAKNKESEAGSMGEILDRWVTDDLVYEMDVTLNSDDDDGGPITNDGKKITVYTQSENFNPDSNKNRFSDDEFKESSLEGIRITLYERIEEIDAIKDEEQSKYSLNTLREVEGNKEEGNKEEGNEEVQRISQQNKEMPRQYEKRIFHKVTYGGKNWSFDDVNRLLENKDYTTFGKMFNHNRNILNYMRGGEYNIGTFLIYASGTNRADVVEHLTNEFKDDIDVWAVDEDGWNAYHYAAMVDNVDVMKHLLSFDRSGLDVGDDNGTTPLHLAASYNRKRMVNLLLDAGASVDVVDNKGRTPDRCTGDVEIKKIIQDHRTKSSS